MTHHPASQAYLERTPGVRERREPNPSRVLRAMRGREPGQSYDFATLAGLSVAATAQAMSVLHRRRLVVVVERRPSCDGGNVYKVAP